MKNSLLAVFSLLCAVALVCPAVEAQTPTSTPILPTPTFTPILPTPTFTPIPPTPTPTPTPPCPPCDCLVKDLWAGRDTWAGTVEICMDTVNSVLSVTFDVTGSGLCLDETHVYANVDNPGSPPDKGAPGRFPFQHEDLSATDCVQIDPYVINDFNLECWQTAALAAHAVVCESLAEPDWTSFVGVFEPEGEQRTAVMMRMTGPSSKGLLSAEILNGGALGGVHDAWYLDVDREMALRNVYMAEPIPSYALAASGEVGLNPAAARLVEYPDNLDAVNWLVNRVYPGRLSSCGGRFTPGDVQRAIWSLVEDGQSTTGIGAWDQCRVDEITAEAMTYGDGFTPGCDQSVAVILNPIQATGRNIARIAIAQVPLSEILAPCELLVGQCETAWAQTLGGDLPFPRGNRRGSYFEYLCE